MKYLVPLLAAVLATGVAACDRKTEGHAQGSTSAPDTVPVKIGESEPPAPPSGSATPPAGKIPADAGDDRRGALSAAGADICGEWNLEGGRLAECRRQWMDARTDADRLRIRDMYEPSAEKKAASEPALDRAPQALNNPAFCDQFNLRSPDLSECRAQWKAAKTEGDLARLKARYETIAANPGAAGSRRPGAPPEAPPANKAPRP